MMIGTRKILYRTALQMVFICQVLDEKNPQRVTFIHLSKRSGLAIWHGVQLKRINVAILYTLLLHKSNWTELSTL